MVFALRSDSRLVRRPGSLPFLMAGLLAVCWLALAPVATFAQKTLEQETGTNPVATGENKTTEPVASVSLDFLDTGAEPESLAQLKAMESRVREVSERVFRATVNIQMGNSQGTGVIVSDDGYILTAAHVVGRPKAKATIVLFDGTELPATALGVNRSIDSGMLKIDLPDDDSQRFPWLDIGESTSLPAGSWVMAIGHPGGLDKNRGMVVRVGRLLASNSQLMRTDCTLVGGDSGGPLVDMHGELVGIHSRIGTNLWENIHVPIDSYSQDWDRLVAGESIGSTRSAYIGLSVVGDTNEVESVEGNGPAEKAGLKKGDIVIGIDSNEIKNRADISRAMRRIRIGQTIKFKVQREGAEMNLELKVGEN